MSDQDKIDVVIANLEGIGKDRMATDLQQLYDSWIKENMELTKRVEELSKPVSPSEDKTAEPSLKELKDQLARNLKYTDWQQLVNSCFRTDDSQTLGECYDAVAEVYGDFRWNKAIEKALKLVESCKGKGFLLNDLISELNKLKHP